MKRFLTISPREGSEPRAATSATSGTGSSCHFAAATSTKRKFDNANYDKEKRKRTFQDQWFGEFAWLSYTSGNDTMACNVCRKFTRLWIICLMWGFIDGSVSGMNRIKTAQRNSMSEVVLQDLMSICVDGPSLEDFDATESINVWLMEGTGTWMVTNQREQHQSRL